MKIISTNKKAYFNYFIEQTYQAGIALVGSEVKSIRRGSTNLTDAYITITSNDEIFIKNMYIAKYDKTSSFVPDERRERKLLLNKSEIKKLHSKVREKGYTIVPTKVYLSGSFVKLEIALAKGKHTYDKKQVLASKDIAKDMQREIKNFNQSH